mmetsp:Transcript_95800/g.247691  ORF Transcript_95800/g.247691 Transcript_95800/m.247691 type:complete len:212 (+) Transcript_95800:1106-1741(+)
MVRVRVAEEVALRDLTRRLLAAQLRGLAPHLLRVGDVGGAHIVEAIALLALTGLGLVRDAHGAALSLHALAHATQLARRDAFHRGAGASVHAVGQRAAVALVGHDVLVEEPQGSELQQVGRRRQRDDGPRDRRAEGATVRCRRVERGRVVGWRRAAGRHGDVIADERRHRRADGYDRHAEVAAAQRVPLVAEDGHDRAPDGGAAARVQGNG